MRKVFPLVLLLGAILAVKAQDAKTISPALQEARNLNTEVVKLFRLKKFQEALPLAKKVVEIKEKELGKDNIETGQALANIGFVYYSLNNKKETERNFENALAIFDKQTSLNKEIILLTADISETLAFIKYKLGKPEAAEGFFEKSLLAYEKAGEKDSLKASQILLSLGKLKNSQRDYGKASNFFEQALAIKIKKSGENDSSASDIFDYSACALKKAGKEKDIKRVQETYFPAAELTENGNLKLPENKTGKDLKPGESGVVNGEALSLPKPPYPAEARQVRASGTVNVQVKINEQGNVFYVCGAFNDINKSLIEAAEAAAYGAKFRPTLLHDKPVKVTGVIVYNFVAQ